MEKNGRSSPCSPGLPIYPPGARRGLTEIKYDRELDIVAAVAPDGTGGAKAPVNAEHALRMVAWQPAVITQPAGELEIGAGELEIGIWKLVY